MGAALTQRPEMFRAVASFVGIYDMLRVELDPNGQFNVRERSPGEPDGIAKDDGTAAGGEQFPTPDIAADEFECGTWNRDLARRAT